MARLMRMSPFMVIFLLVSIGVMILPGQGIRELAPAPAVSLEFVQDCATKLGNCDLEVYLGVFEDEHVSANCCAALLSMGKECHDDLVQYLLLEPDFKGNLTEILARREQVWNDCSVSASSPLSF